MASDTLPMFSTALLTAAPPAPAAVSVPDAAPLQPPPDASPPAPQQPADVKPPPQQPPAPTAQPPPPVAVPPPMAAATFSYPPGMVFAPHDPAATAAPVMDDQPTYVNPKQYARILKRRESRKKQTGTDVTSYTPRKRSYMHESRHKHAMQRRRGPGGRFLSKDDRGGNETVAAGQ